MHAHYGVLLGAWIELCIAVAVVHYSFTGESAMRQNYYS